MFNDQRHRHQKFTAFLLLILAISLIFTQCKKEEGPPPGPPEFTSLKAEVNYLVGKYLHVGFMVGVIDMDHQKQIYSYGSKTKNSNDRPDQNTVFEIGSINKSFTCLLYKQFLLQGKLENDTAQSYLPADEVILPEKNNKPILLYHLATHSSGIPRSPHYQGVYIPPGFDDQNPYDAYTNEMMYDYYSNNCELLFEPGSGWEYSNAGMGLLGHINGIADGTDYETVLKREVFDPLQMNSSSLFLTSEQKQNVATGYNQQLQQLPEFIAPDIFQGAGFIKSSMADMFKYLEAQMGLIESTLREAMDDCQQPQFEVDYFGEQCFCSLP